MVGGSKVGGGVGKARATGSAGREDSVKVVTNLVAVLIQHELPVVTITLQKQRTNAETSAAQSLLHERKTRIWAMLSQRR